MKSSVKSASCSSAFHFSQASRNRCSVAAWTSAGAGIFGFFVLEYTVIKRYSRQTMPLLQEKNSDWKLSVFFKGDFPCPMADPEVKTATRVSPRANKNGSAHWK